MKTLADFKRDVVIGRRIRRLYRMGKECNEVRTITHKQSNSFCISKDEQGNGKVWLDFPKASLLDYDGKSIRIYEAGIRPLTAEEKAVIDGRPRDPEQEKVDMLSDGNVMFYREKQYYKESGMEYLNGYTTAQGKRLTRNNRDENGLIVPMIEDESIKGKLSLAYEWVEA